MHYALYLDTSAVRLVATAEAAMVATGGMAVPALD